MAQGSVPHHQLQDGHQDTGTLSPGEYGCIIEPDGTKKWWVRTPRGAWALLTHHRVTKHEDGTLSVDPEK